MVGRILKKIKKEKGAVQIVEATFVFPIMFIILFFLIYMGNAFYIKSQIEAVVEKYAVQGAAYCADPILETIKEENRIPTVKELEAEPYRYIFGGMSEVEKMIGDRVENEIKSKSSSLFSNMSPTIKTPKSNIATFNNYIVYSTFSVEVKYTLKFPIKFLGKSSPTILSISSRAEMPVDDTAEFIRNTDMVIDLFGETKAGEKISQAFGKINEFISNFAKKK